MSNILIVGAGGSAANNFIEAVRLDTDKYTFVGIDQDPYMLELSTADIKINQKEYIRWDETIDYGSLCKDNKIDFVHCQPDNQILPFIFENIDVKSFLPSVSAIDFSQNKLQCNEKLESNSIAVPQSFYGSLSNIEAMLQLHKKVWLRAIKGAGSKAALPVTNIEQARGWLNYWKQKAPKTEMMVCEYLPGPEYAWQSLWYEGELICAQSRERCQYLHGNWMPSGQSSSPSIARTISDERVTELGLKACKALMDKPHGVFCIDMKMDYNANIKVTEINAGRFFTTSNFFAHAGLNMPAMYLELGTQGHLEDRPGRCDPLPDDLFWVRQTDMGYKLLQGPL